MRLATGVGLGQPSAPRGGRVEVVLLLSQSTGPLLLASSVLPCGALRNLADSLHATPSPSGAPTSSHSRSPEPSPSSPMPSTAARPPKVPSGVAVPSSLCPAVTVLLARASLNEQIDRRRVSAIAVLLAGVLLKAAKPTVTGPPARRVRDERSSSRPRGREAAFPDENDPSRTKATRASADGSRHPSLDLAAPPLCQRPRDAQQPRVSDELRDFVGVDRLEANEHDRLPAIVRRRKELVGR